MGRTGKEGQRAGRTRIVHGLDKQVVINGLDKNKKLDAVRIKSRAGCQDNKWHSTV